MSDTCNENTNQPETTSLTPTEPDRARHLVVIGSSAGGIEALSTLVGTLPPDFTASIVLAQHLDPTRPSQMAAIMQRRSALPVEIVTTHSQLEPGVIYAVPSNQHVVIEDGRLELQGDHADRPRPSIDLLLSSAARAYGENLIAVILTGAGSDGAAGAVEVKNAGGVVVVQNPNTARYPSMPLALPPSIIDFEVDIEQIGPLLDRLVRGQEILAMADNTEHNLQGILELVNRQASIDFRLYKTTTIMRRLHRRMTITNQRTMYDYALYLETHPQEVGELVQAFLINVTQFFRDAEAFNFLKTQVVPGLIEQARLRDRTLRFWCAGCASGEEPYSLAMLVTDLLGPELAQWSVKIFATDLDEAAISFARRGIYTENVLNGVPADYRARFFDQIDAGFRVAKSLRQIVIFGHQDLSRSAPFPRMDLVLCRNVLIYFTPELQNYVLNQFSFSLAGYGYLFLGKAETVRPSQSQYEMVNKTWKIYRCNLGTLPTTTNQRRYVPLPTSLAKYRVEPQRAMTNLLQATNPLDENDPAREVNQLRLVNELVLRFLPVGLVVIDRNYRLLTANGVARRVLGLREMATDQDFLHSVRGIPYNEVRTAIDTVFRDRTTVQLPEVELDRLSGGSGRFLSFSMAIMQWDSRMSDMVALSVSDVTEQVETRQQLEQVQADQSRLMSELSDSNRRLNDLNKEMTDSNEELQVSNEELMLTHEELQASIEEYETTNEELQATNEELETNNEELQATNEELETTNDELRSLTQEMQEVALNLEGERTRLVEMVSLAPFYILLLRGPNLLIEVFNPRYLPLLHGRPVVGLALGEVAEFFPDGSTTVLELARQTYQQDITTLSPRLLTRLPDKDNQIQQHYFTYTLVPSHDATGKVTGVIIYGQDAENES